MDHLWVIVTAPIHSRGSIGEQFNASFNTKFVQNCSNEEITHLYLGWPESTFSYFLGELFTIHHEMKINYLYFL